jgi:hypothetical protein
VDAAGTGPRNARGIPWGRFFHSFSMGDLACSIFRSRPLFQFMVGLRLETSVAVPDSLNSDQGPAFEVNPDPGFDDQKSKKKIQL